MSPQQTAQSITKRQSKMTSTISKISWTSDEESSINAEAIRLRAVKPELTRGMLLTRAQLVLKPARRRLVKNLKRIDSWFAFGADMNPRVVSPISKVQAASPAPASAVSAADIPPEVPTHSKSGAALSPRMQQRMVTLASRGLAIGKRADGMPKVRWKSKSDGDKPSEQAQVIDSAASLVLAGQCDLNHPTELLRKAQEVLPPDRHQDIAGVSAKPWFVPGVIQAVEKRRKSEAIQRLEMESRNVQLQIDAEIAAAAPPSAPSEVVAASMPQSDALSNLAGLRTTLVTILADIIKDAFREALAASAPAAPAEPAALTEPPRPLVEELRPPHKPYVNGGVKRDPLKSVLVIGLRGSQEEILKARFGHRLDLSFHATNDSKQALKDKAKGADVTVGFTDFMSHSIEAVAEARSPNYIRSGGGMSSLCETLESLVAAGHTIGAAAQAQSTAH